MKVAFLIVFGTRWLFRPVSGGWDGRLNCPVCRLPKRMVEKEALKAFTVYGFPVFIRQRAGHLIECDECFTKFRVPPEVLAATGRDPGVPSEPAPLVPAPVGEIDGAG